MTVKALGIAAFIITSSAASVAETLKPTTQAQRLDARQCVACHKFSSEQTGGDGARRKIVPLDDLTGSRLEAILGMHPGFNWRNYSARELQGLATQLKRLRTEPGPITGR
ncbi:MAG: hypothetical protein ACR2P1_11405 [Pseudomonadales bacterium]